MKTPWTSWKTQTRSSVGWTSRSPLKFSWKKESLRRTTEPSSKSCVPKLVDVLSAHCSHLATIKGTSANKQARILSLLQTTRKAVHLEATRKCPTSLHRSPLLRMQTSPLTSLSIALEVIKLTKPKSPKEPITLHTPSLQATRSNNGTRRSHSLKQ